MDSTQQLLKFEQVSALVGLGRTAIYRKVREGTFPPPLHISRRASRWRAADVQRWIDGLPTEKKPMLEPITEFEALTGKYLSRLARANGKEPPRLEAVQRYAKEVEDLLTSRLNWTKAPIEKLVLARDRLAMMSDEFHAASKDLLRMGLPNDEAQDAILGLPSPGELQKALMFRIKQEKPDLDVLEPTSMKESELRIAEANAEKAATSEKSAANLLKVLEAEVQAQHKRLQIAQVCAYGRVIVFEEQERMSRLAQASINARTRLNEWRRQNPVGGGQREITQADFDAWNKRNPLAAQKSLKGGEVRIVG